MKLAKFDAFFSELPHFTEITLNYKYGNYLAILSHWYNPFAYLCCALIEKWITTGFRFRNDEISNNMTALIIFKVSNLFFFFFSYRHNIFIINGYKWRLFFTFFIFQAETRYFRSTRSAETLNNYFLWTCVFFSFSSDPYKVVIGVLMCPKNNVLRCYITAQLATNTYHSYLYRVHITGATMRFHRAMLIPLTNTLEINVLFCVTANTVTGYYKLVYKKKKKEKKNRTYIYITHM